MLQIMMEVLDHDLGVELDHDLGVELLIPIMAKSVRILFTSHDHCWTVGQGNGEVRLFHTCSAI